MRRFIPLLIIALVATIAILGVLPGCDELVTNESFDSTTIIVRDSTCVAFCHSDISNTMDIEISRWENSAHAREELVDTAILGQNSRQCGPECHSTEGFVRSITGNNIDTVLYTEIGCFACHAPHTNWDFSVRDTSSVALENGSSYSYNKSNICARCHKSLNSQAELVLETTTIDDDWIRWAIHGSTQADILAGSGGYEYPGKTYVHSQHKTKVISGCYTCHQEYTRGLTMGGHSYNLRQENIFLLETCNRSGCHEAIPFQDFVIAQLQDDFSSKLDSLKLKLIEDSLLDVVTELPINGKQITDKGLTGALYNYFFVLNDRSRGIHNLTYDTLLIRTSLDYLNVK